MAFLVIDEPHISALVKIAAMQDGEVADLVAALSDLPRTIDRTQVFAVISSRARNIAKPVIEEIVDTLFFLHSTMASSRVTLKKFVSDVCDAVAKKDSDSVILEGGHRSRLEWRLSTLLSIDSLRLTAKATDLAYESPNIFQGVRILTDVRPLFKSGPTPAIEGALITHTLKINYYTDRGPREIYLAMDGDDLEAIRKALDRAERKAAILNSVMVKSNIPNLNEPNFKGEK